MTTTSIVMYTIATGPRFVNWTVKVGRIDPHPRIH